MYPNFKAECARKDLTLERLVELLGERGIKRTVSTMSLKLTGKYKLTLNEAKALKDIVGTELPLDVLFAERVTE